MRGEPRYYRRDGTPYEGDEAYLLWAKDFENPKIHHVLVTTLPDGKWVSTVWLGLNHNYGVGSPLIFETMVFPKKGEYHDLDCERYSTEEEAKASHHRMVEKWKGAKSCMKKDLP